MMIDIFPAFQIRPEVVRELTSYGNKEALVQDKIDVFHTYANSNRTKEELVRTYDQLFPERKEFVNFKFREQGENAGAAPPNNTVQRKP